jgi:aryl-alcohol dehydrogenase-like predicted oxidoreductase
MQYKSLGKTGLMVSQVCLGTMTFGKQVSEEEAVRLTHIALDRGVNFIDTANSYFGGQSEICVGKALKGRRDQVVLTTKAGFKVGEGPLEKGLSRASVMQQVEKSLKRLDTDYIDIYFMHLPDHVTAIEDALETYTDLVRSGKVRYIGMSNFSAWEVCEALWKSEAKNILAPSVTEMVYNLITRGLDTEFIPFCQMHKMGLITYNPLAGGILSGKYQKSETPPENSRYSILKAYAPRYWREDYFETVDVLRTVAEEHDMSMAELAMRFVVSNPAITSVLVGFSKEAQLLQNLESVEKGALPADALDMCGEVWKKLSGNTFQYNR